MGGKFGHRTHVWVAFCVALCVGGMVLCGVLPSIAKKDRAPELKMAGVFQPGVSNLVIVPGGFRHESYTGGQQVPRGGQYGHLEAHGRSSQRYAYQATKQPEIVRQDSEGLATTRRTALATLGYVAPAVLSSARPALAVRDDVEIDADPVPPFSIEEFSPAKGWMELDSGLLYKVVQEGEGDKQAGIFDKVDHFQPYPFVAVKYTAYDPSGKAFAAAGRPRKDYNYQAGVRQEVQDENGAVMSMKVGERRQFVVPAELAYKRKLFGKPVPPQDAILVDVELLAIRPY